ncbi:MAG: hypothetical protein JWM90_1708 [Thermoleophilia bacterium]|nr:hypothetical protein [Thermoleophilia bacterium]
MSKWKITGVLAAACSLVVGAPTQAAAGPSAAYIRAEGTNPTIAQKVLGYDRWVRSAGRPPGVLVLGSSRSVMIDPQRIRAVSDVTAYNAGVSNGAARELLTLASYADIRSPGQLPHLVILLDLEAFARRATTTRQLDYQRRILAARAACANPTSCRLPWLRTARAIGSDAVARQRGGRPYTQTQRTDGRQINGQLQQWEAQGVDLGAVRARRIQQRITGFRPGGYFTQLYAVQQVSFERLLALANERGVEPVVALTSMHPDCIRLCGPAGWNARRAEVRAWLQEVDARREFRLIDLSLPSMWGGSGRFFLDEVHLRDTGAARVVDRLNRFGAFRPR